MKVDDSRIAAIAAQPPLVKPNIQQQKQLLQEFEQPNTTAKASDKVTIQLEIPKNTLDTLQKVGNVGELLISTARNVRKTDEALTAGAEMIEVMKANLEKIVKSFPPFSQDSQERFDLLMSYSSLQKEIASLMVPPPPPPIYEKVQHLWDNLFTGNARTIPAPQLPPDAPDSHIKAVVNQLGSLSGQVRLAQEAMSNSVKEF